MNMLSRVVVGLLLGCGSLAHAAPPEAVQTLTLTVDGVERTALVYVPPVPAAGPVPLVFAFHGHGGTARYALNKFAVDRLWPDAISVYPQGLDTPGQLTDPEGRRSGWQKAGGDQADRDLHFFDALLARMQKDHAVDPKRVYCTGHSNGGGFTYLLWLARPAVFAAVAPCSGAARYSAQLTPKPAMISGGKSDPLVKFAWQQMELATLTTVNGCVAEGVPWAGVGTLYPSAGGTPLVTYFYDGEHQMTDAEPGLIVRFFHEHPAP